MKQSTQSTISLSENSQNCANMNSITVEAEKQVETNPIAVSPIRAVNVASVPQRSPLRYPGGKTWLIPHIRYWLENRKLPPRHLIEPFAGGGIVSLTAVMEGLVEHCVMSELDHEVAAFWNAALYDAPALCDRVLQFHPTRKAIDKLSNSRPQSTVDRGFRTLVLNRTRRGGILAPGASFSRSGEAGKGVASRWYPETIVKRLRKIAVYSDKITFCETDGVKLLERELNRHNLDHETKTDQVVFVDPPYTAGGKRAGKRLYTHNEIDHVRLFGILADSQSSFLMTYDKAPEIVSLSMKHGFHIVQVTMKNTHHAKVPELIITPKPVFVQ